MIKIAICDDEQFFVDEENNIISNYLNSKKLKYEILSYISGQELLKSDINKYDIIFLDMEMPGMDGMEVAMKLRDKGVNAEIVFVTAYVKYSTQGYHVGAFRYIIKDNKIEFTINECLEAFIKIKKICATVLDVVFENSVKKLHTSLIVYIESNKHDLIYHVIEDKHIKKYNVRGRVSDCLYLNKYGIYQVHKGILVNFDYVESIERYKMILKNNYGTVDIGQPRYDKVYAQYIDYKCRGMRNA